MNAASAERPWTRATWALLAVQVAVVLLTFRDYGITYDEEWRATYGEYVLRWYASGFEDRRALTYWTLPLEGGFFGALSQLFALGSPLGRYETTHLAGALFGSLATLGTARVGRRLGGPAAGFLAALILAATPRWYGELFANPIDMPMATLSIWAIAWMLECLDQLPRPRAALLGRLGIAIGLALATRIGAVILLVYVAFAFSLWFLVRRLARPEGAPLRAGLRCDLLGAGRAFLVVCLFAYPSMLLFWPAAQVHPLQPVWGLRNALNFGYDIPVLFDGEVVSNQLLPRWYVLEWFALVMPEHVLAALAVGAVLGARALSRAPRSALSGARLAHLALLATVAGPLLYVTAGRPVDYDGIRHYLFVVPPLAALAAISIVRLLGLLGSSAARAAALGTFGVLAAIAVSDMVRLHPYQYVYFNRLVAGGLPGARGSYDLDYWGASLREGAEWLAASSGSEIDGRRPRVASCLYALSSSYFLPPERFEYVGSVDDGAEGARWRAERGSPWPDYYLALPRWGGERAFPGEVIHTVERMGTPLSWVVEVARP